MAIWSGNLIKWIRFNHLVKGHTDLHGSANLMADMVANRSNGGYGVKSQDLLTGSGSGYADQERGPRVRVRSARGPSGFKTPSFKGLIKGFFFLFFQFLFFCFFLFFFFEEREALNSLSRAISDSLTPPPPPPRAAVFRRDLRPMMDSFERSRPDLSRSGLYFSRIWAYGCESRFETSGKIYFFFFLLCRCWGSPLQGTVFRSIGFSGGHGCLDF